MQTVVYSGTLDATTAIAHGSRQAGNAHPFRRETLILPTGKRLTGVPVVSGGVVRGSLRRTAAAMTQHALVGNGRLPLPVVHALRTGGALRETRKGREMLNGERQAILRDAIPMLAVFGLAAGGRIMSGRLQVGKPLPVAQETSHLAEHYGVDLSTYEPPSVRQLLQREVYTRIADVDTATAAPFVAPDDTFPDQDSEDASDKDQSGGNMIYQHETLAAGTRLFHTIVLDNVTDLEAAFFDDLLAQWAPTAAIGGQLAKGLGRVVPRYTRTCYDLTGTPMSDVPTADWRSHMIENRDNIERAMAWL